jgi:hypothetical protein
MSIPCSSLKQNTIKQKFVASANVNAVVSENIDYPGYTRTNRGRGGGSELQSSFQTVCDCFFPLNVTHTLAVSGPFSGEYVDIFPGGANTFPYTIDVTVGFIYIWFLCNKNYIDIYSNWIEASNLSENPAEQVSPPGLNSTGTVTLSFFGQSTTITLLNTWTPGWSVDPGYQGNWRLDATLELNLSDCYE